MTDDATATATVDAPETEFDRQTDFPAPDAAVETSAESFLADPERFGPSVPPAPSVTNGNGAAPLPPRLRTAWKRKQDSAHQQPGKPSAKPAIARGAARPVAGGGRSHAPGPDGLPKPLHVASPPVTPTHAAPPVRPPTPRAAIFYPPLGPNPKAKPRGAAHGRQPPSGTIVAGRRNPRWPAIQKWLGTALIAIGVVIAVGAVGGNYLVQRHTESENAAFEASLSQFGPTPTPLTARATSLAGRGAAGVPSGPGAAVSTSGAVRPGRDATAIATDQGAAAPGGASQSPQPATLPMLAPTPRAMPPMTQGAQGAPALPGGPPPIVAGGGVPGNRAQATATPRPPSRDVSVPPISPVNPRPPPTTAPAPMPMPMPMTAMQPGMNPDGGDQPMATAQPEPAPTPEPPPKQPLPTHVRIPAIGVNSSIVEVGVSPTQIDGEDVYIWDVAAYAVGHHFSSASPGEGENVVFSGHDDWQGEVFRDLYKLKKGDKITVQAGDQTWSYHVDSLLLLQEVGAPLEQRLNNALYIGTTGDERLTLITCWPYGIDDHRIVVIARPDWCTDC